MFGVDCFCLKLLYQFTLITTPFAVTKLTQWFSCNVKIIHKESLQTTHIFYGITIIYLRFKKYSCLFSTLIFSHDDAYTHRSNANISRALWRWEMMKIYSITIFILFYHVWLARIVVTSTRNTSRFSHPFRLLIQYSQFLPSIFIDCRSYTYY